jgi:regulator of sigma E protease
MLEITSGAFSHAFARMPSWILMASDTSLLETWGNRIYYIFLVVLGLGFVIFVHELGHFLAAKLFGVKCEKFYVGFDVPIKIGPLRLPSKLFHFQWGETEYGIGVIPLGGYVKMLGQDDDPRRLKEESERIRASDPDAQDGVTGTPRLDPRSYPAKPVFARMIIISAGVIMNLIFGVLMAAVAFLLGVPYDPAVIGQVTPGDPAWKQGIQAGDKMVQVASASDEQLSFSDMRQKVAIAGLRDALSPVKVTYERDGKRTSLEIVGTTSHSAADSKLKLLTLGVRPTSTTRLNSKHAFQRHIRGQGIDLGALQPGDRIVAVDGEPLAANALSGEPLGYQLDALLHPRLNESVTLTVNRESEGKASTAGVVVAPLPLKTFGVRFQLGAVSNIADDSLAAKAGVAIGDELVRFNGAPIQDALTLPNLVAGMSGKNVQLEMKRSGGESYTLEWRVPEAFQLVDSISMVAPVGFELPGAGLVYTASNVIASIAPGSAAEKNGLVAGDRVKQIQFVPRTAEQKEFYKDVIDSKTMLEKIPVDATRNIQYFFEFVQIFPVDMPMVIYVERESKVESADAAVMTEEGLHWPDRGLQLEPFKKTHIAETTMQALSLGAREVWRRLGDVLEFLQLLVTGKAFNAIGGPGSIALQATDAASQGISPLLMFLTFLSANLAIVNFLPIPALDGGHMMFLIAEAILGRPIDEELQAKLTIGGVLALLSLMIWAIFNDYINLSRYFGG